MQWSKDGSPVSGGSSSQIVTDTVEATYINELTVTGRQNGTYTCNVTTWRAYRDDDNSTVDTMVGSPAISSITVEGTCMYMYVLFYGAGMEKELRVDLYSTSCFHALVTMAGLHS